MALVEDNQSSIAVPFERLHLKLLVSGCFIKQLNKQ